MTASSNVSTRGTDFRATVRRALLADGYTVTAAESDVSDPFAWSLTARKDGYEITVRERALDR